MKIRWNDREGQQGAGGKRDGCLSAFCACKWFPLSTEWDRLWGLGGRGSLVDLKRKSLSVHLAPRSTEPKEGCFGYRRLAEAVSVQTKPPLEKTGKAVRAPAHQSPWGRGCFASIRAPTLCLSERCIYGPDSSNRSKCVIPIM